MARSKDTQSRDTQTRCDCENTPYLIVLFIENVNVLFDDYMDSFLQICINILKNIYMNFLKSLLYGCRFKISKINTTINVNKFYKDYVTYILLYYIFSHHILISKSLI